MKWQSLIAATALCASAALAQAEPLNLTMAGASPGGLWSLLGAGVDTAVKAVDGDSVVTYQTSGGGFANIALVEKGQADLALAHDAELKQALAGKEPFSEPVEGLAAVGYLYTWAPEQFFITKSMADEYGIESLGDIAEKKPPIDIVVNRPGNIVGDIALAMLAAAGVTEDKVAEWGGTIVRAGSGEQAGLIKDGRVDMLGNSLFVLHSSLRDVESSIDVKLLKVPDDVIETVNAELGTQRFTIPAGTYKNQDEAVDTTTVGAMIIVRQDMDEETVYQLTKALIDNIDKLKGVHKSMAALTPELMASQTTLPFHPGAERAYKEAGLM